MKQNFAAIILGGTGQVGGAAVAELLATSECREVVMVTRKPIALRSRVRNVGRSHANKSWHLCHTLDPAKRIFMR